MVKSMTGFGRSELIDENRKITVELKSVNHRYLDANIRMPKKLNFFDASLRGVWTKGIQSPHAVSLFQASASCEPA